MVSTLHLALALGLVCLLRFIHLRILTLLVLWHVPGPRRHSWLWGEEQILYHGSPGTHYAEWHREFGKVVRISGAFGVRLSVHRVHLTEIVLQRTKSCPSLTLVPSATSWGKARISSPSLMV